MLVLESNAIGSGQTLASQGIIHSGLKYLLGGKVNPAAREISAMPVRWRETLQNSCVAAPSQHLLIPKGVMGSVTKIAAKKILGHTAQHTPAPKEIKSVGFNGSVVSLNEPVLDIKKVLATITDQKFVRKINLGKDLIKKTNVIVNGETIHAQRYIFCTGNNNDLCAQGMRQTIKSQKRPLLMGMIKNAPFPLFAHMVGKTDKPLATITTHTSAEGAHIWYIGGLVAERHSDADPEDTFDAIKTVFAKFFPQLDLSGVQWGVLGIDRAEGAEGGRMPNKPVIQRIDHALYCWPTKLTFAPLLADMVVDNVMDIKPSGHQTDWSFLPFAEFAAAPWDTAKWKK